MEPYSPTCRKCGAPGKNTVGGTYFQCGSHIGCDMGSPFEQSEDCVIRQAAVIQERRAEYDALPQAVRDEREAAVRFAAKHPTWRAGDLVKALRNGDHTRP